MEISKSKINIIDYRWIKTREREIGTQQMDFTVFANTQTVRESVTYLDLREEKLGKLQKRDK